MTKRTIPDEEFYKKKHAERLFDEKDYEGSLKVFEGLYKSTRDEEYLIQISWMRFAGLGCAAEYKDVIEYLEGYEITKDLSYAIAGMNFRLKNYEKAFYWYEKSLEFNNKKALFRLGLIFEYGYLGGVDLKKSKHFYQKGARENMFSCRLKMIRLDRRGGFLRVSRYFLRIITLKIEVFFWIIQGKDIDNVIDLFSGEVIAKRKMKVFPRHP